jgi:hypothetical protein
MFAKVLLNRALLLNPLRLPFCVDAPSGRTPKWSRVESESEHASTTPWQYTHAVKSQGIQSSDIGNVATHAVRVLGVSALPELL